MKCTTWLRLMACLLCCGAGLATSPAAALGERLSSEASSIPPEGGTYSSREASLVISGSPTEAEQLQAQQEAKRSTPEAVAQREASRTKFEGLGPEQAVKVAAEAFPGIAEPAGGKPKLPVGQSIVGYPTVGAVQVDLGGGRYGLIESAAPMAVETSPGRQTPIDLSLNGAGGAFEPTTPLVGVRIPKRLGAGVQLPRSGVSLTPVDGSGAPLGGSEGELDGASVVYANTQTDADMVVKPTTTGFEADTMLLSVDSPEQLHFQVGLPAGASLVHTKAGSGSVEIMKEGVTIGTVLAPSAVDAAGTAVPVTMGVKGDILTLAIADRTQEYLFPIEADPTYTEEQLTTAGTRRTNWQFHPGKGGTFKERTASGVLETYAEGATYTKEELAYWAYQTQGDSDIYEVTTKTWAHNPGAHIESLLELQYGEAEKGITENKTVPPLSDETESTTEYEGKPTTLCASPSETEKCLALTGHEHNAVHFQQSSTASCSGCSFSDSIREQALVYLAEPTGTHSTTSLNKTSESLEIEVENEKHEKVKQNRRNALFGSTTWLSGFSGAIQAVAKDPGIGISATKLEYEYAAGKWEQIVEHNYLETEGGCTGVQCAPEHTEVSTLPSKLPDGEDKIRYKAHDAMPGTESLAGEGTGTVKVDTSKPHRIFLGGLPYGNELSEKAYKVTAYATDGEGSTLPSSGVASIAVFVENGKGEKKEITKTGGTGECSAAKGECTASAEYTINGAELGAGHHGIVITTKDRAGNEGREEEELSVRHSTPVTLGPGSVDLESGDYTLSANDVTMGAGLTVSRNYSSRALTEGELGPLGPQWDVSLGTSESLAEMVDGSVLVTLANGGQTIFNALHNAEGKPTGKFEAPPGDSNLAVRLEENGTKEKIAYYLEDALAHTKTKFTLPVGGGKEWVPTVQEGIEATDTVTFTYQTVEVGGKKITRPTEELAPHPAVSCAPKMQPGCRGLKFTYAEHTKPEIGEGPSEWGEYEGRLIKVSYEGYNPGTKGMTATPIPVAQYAYDKLGRLRAEWDPRISPVLQTEYGYDAEGHVTALDPPGQEPWLFTYGSATGDAGTGRLVKATRAPASTELWSGKVPGSPLPKPKIAGTSLTGERMSVSIGKWSNNPIVYSYQWEDCNTAGTGCAIIQGANNPNYTPSRTDLGHTLVVEVSAANGGGTTTAATAASHIVWGTATPVYATQFGKESESEVQGVAVDKKGHVWTSTGGSAGFLKEWALSGEKWEILKTISGLSYPEGVAVSPKGDIWVASSGNKRLCEYTEEATSLGCVGTSTGGGEGDPYGVAVDSHNNVWITICWTNPTDKEATHVEEFKESGELIRRFGRTGHGHGEFEEPVGIAVDSHGHVWVADRENPSEYLQQLTEAGSFLKVAGTYGSGQGALSGVGGLAIDSQNNLWVPNRGADDIYGFNESGEFETSFGQEGKGDGQYSAPEGVAIDSSGNAWVADSGNHRVQKSTPEKVVEGEAVSPGPGTTLEYNVPVVGSGAPHNMSEHEIAKWGQKASEAPEEATALIPPDSPQGWPATSYTRASIYYLDSLGRVVNTAEPSAGTYGDIATTEYNEFNDVVRMLTPDSRATVLADPCESPEHCQSAEVSHLLDTVSVYNEPNVWDEAAGCRKETDEPESEKAEPGTRLCETWGPEHPVKYVPNGYTTQVERLARKHTKYYYEDAKHYEEAGLGAPPAGEKYDLVTETQVLAQLFNAEGKSEGEDESRRAKTSYSGQGKLGWELRAPTLVIAASEAEGAKLERKTVYVEAGEARGEVKELRGPKGLSGESAHDSRSVYYTAEENKEGVAACGKHPEWAGLICETLPGKQPAETAAVPALPDVTPTYNIWDEPEKVEETIAKTATEPTAVRTKSESYDEAGRLKTSETASTSTKDTALPKVTDEYSASTGLLETQSAPIGGKTKTITSKYNKLGQLESYTDADGNVAKYKYGAPEADGLLEEMSDSSGEGAGGTNRSTQKYTYSATTKAMIKLEDSAGGLFTASYDTEGKLTSETYPNNTCAAYTYNAMGEATHMEYTKTATCGEAGAPVWFFESKIPSVRGETMSRVSSLASESYTYDTLGRLTEAQETPVGEYCKTRSYAYEEESNRTSETAREPNAKKECATEGGTVQQHAYDEANRLTDAGIEYDPLGNITTLPVADGEGHELKTGFYVDNAVAAQEQNGTKDEYFLDPNGRVRETLSGAKDSMRHYDASGETVAWTCEVASGTKECEAGSYTRNIPGIDGTLAAVQTNAGPVVLQLHDLEGDVVATAADNTTETKLLSTYNSTEFGVPNAGKAPPPFAWLGASDVQSSLATGVITYGATSYVPQTGRPLQSEEVEPPGVPGGSGVGTPYTAQEEPWNMQGAERVASEAPGKEAAREREAALKAAMATLIDPEGLMTGEEALTLASQLQKAKSDLNYYNNQEEYCGEALNPKACELYFESGETEDGNLATALEGCYHQVHDLGTYHGHYYSKTCLVDFAFTEFRAQKVIEPGWSLNLCFSYLVGKNAVTYSTSSWWCESDKKWWTFSNRGWWEPY